MHGEHQPEMGTKAGQDLDDVANTQKQQYVYPTNSNFNMYTQQYFTSCNSFTHLITNVELDLRRSFPEFIARNLDNGHQHAELSFAPAADCKPSMHALHQQSHHLNSISNKHAPLLACEITILIHA
jgi:hypothetical protein